MWPLFRRSPPPTIDSDLWRRTCARTPWVCDLDDSRRSELRRLSERFLREKTITPVAGLELDFAQYVQLAALCCLPLTDIGARGWAGWSQIILYPDAFRVRRSEMDEAGVLHEWDEEADGEAWQGGPMILSWTDLQGDLAEPDAGYCMTAHEMAHKLDLLDGEFDGTPLLSGGWRRLWARDFQREFDVLCERVDRDEETAINPYAAESPEEFFAVVSEYHFSAPRRLREAMPEVAAHLRRFYGPPPTW